MTGESPPELPPVPPGYANSMPPVMEATRLVRIETDPNGRAYFLTADAAKAWTNMRSAAADSGISLRLVSAFRSITDQRKIVLRKIQIGQSLTEILRVNAYPGHSEHHSGCALDIGTDHGPDLEEAFENTPAFAWLEANANQFGFILSYPRNNHSGVIYEPWHWRFQPRALR
tara:strand:+ start:86 stop:601 length:516 start_codon:yes stop_codon:yes gene_type:complete